MTISILATGDEIIHGDTLNTNAHAIAKILSSEGLSLGFHVTCSDKEADLLASIDFLAQKQDVIISIGGLGPTSDDRTRFAFAQYFGLELQEFPEAIGHIKARLARADLPFDEGNRRQSLFPTQATLLPNPHGTAMGCMVSVHHKMMILLPGPPGECLPMFEQYVLPLLQKMGHSHKQLCIWQLFGVSEGQVSARLEEALFGMDCRTGYRLDMPYLEFKVMCDPRVVERIRQIIDPLVAPYVICPPKQKASQLLRERLNHVHKTVVILDKATGGVLETLLRRPENATTLSFSPNPSARLCFKIAGLDAYWNSKDVTSDCLTMHYQIDDHVGEEQHTVPFRGHAGVLNYAAEWLSFRILHLINEVH